MPERKLTIPAWVAIAFAGGFGGTAPNVFRVGTGLTAGQPLPELSYMLGVLIFFLMGLGVALAFQEEDVKKAFFLGLSLPAMFQSGVADLTVKAAAPAAIVERTEDATREVTVHVSEGGPDFTVVFSAAGRGREEAIPRPTRSPTIARLDVPLWAEAFQVLVDGEMSDPYEVIEQEDWVIEITPAPLRGLKEALGAKGSARWKVFVGKKEKGK